MELGEGGASRFWITEERENRQRVSRCSISGHPSPLTYGIARDSFIPGADDQLNGWNWQSCHSRNTNPEHQGSYPDRDSAIFRSARHRRSHCRRERVERSRSQTRSLPICSLIRSRRSIERKCGSPRDLPAAE